MNIYKVPGLRQHLNKLGHSFIRKVNADQEETWGCSEGAEDIINSYSEDQSRDYLKRMVDEIESEKFDTAFIETYGFVPPAQQMLKWPDKEIEALAWQAWADGDQSGDEPPTPIIDKELTTAQTRSVRVAKVISKGAALESLRGAIEHNSVELDDQLNAAETFEDLVSVDLYLGWPV